MIKRLMFFLASMAVLFIGAFMLHTYGVNTGEYELVFSLLGVYSFHFVAAIIVYTIVEVTANKLPTQAGYAYLASIFLKIGFFVLIFQATVFTETPLTKVERISLVIPLFLFLIAEAVFVSKLLNNK